MKKFKLLFIAIATLGMTTMFSCGGGETGADDKDSTTTETTETTEVTETETVTEPETVIAEDTTSVEMDSTEATKE